MTIVRTLSLRSYMVEMTTDRELSNRKIPMRMRTQKMIKERRSSSLPKRE
jgi:hypothetical protein